jgi:hypothetical protein
MSKLVRRTVLALAVASLCVILPDRADDGYISTGGNPHRMDKPTTVSMQSERVDIDIDDNLVTVDCKFVFKNQGEACLVRMGFPDQSTSERADSKSPRGSFRSYKSYVDGNEVPTEVVAGGKKKGNEGAWHSKFVDFPAHSVRQVRDVYTDIEGGFQLPPDGAAHFFSYILHTASSWNGPIEDGEVRINLKTLTKPPRAVDGLAVRDPRNYFRSAPAETVLYTGPCKPTVSGKTLVFHFKNLRPKEDSDISVLYQYVRNPKADSSSTRK